MTTSLLCDRTPVALSGMLAAALHVGLFKESEALLEIYCAFRALRKPLGHRDSETQLSLNSKTDRCGPSFFQVGEQPLHWRGVAWGLCFKRAWSRSIPDFIAYIHYTQAIVSLTSALTFTIYYWGITAPPLFDRNSVFAA